MEALHGRSDGGQGPGAQAARPGATDSRVTLRVNDATHTVELEHCATLQEVLRDSLGLTGSKKRCDDGRCGACTVLLDGRRVVSCLLLAVAQEGREVVTVEGLAGTPGAHDSLHPLRRPSADRDAYQCGYCAPDQNGSPGGTQNGAAGQPLVVTDMELPENVPVLLTAAEVLEQLSGHLCRCGAYPSTAGAGQDVIA
ncbi:(2Fe-2S)-binding protein [Streptomyces violascens]|uniref:(2Fe-2S)-binding protein n=1 Tax=Streptomyces violascens TaxID=67381 RepID=UPI003662FB24